MVACLTIVQVKIERRAVLNRHLVLILALEQIPDEAWHHLPVSVYFLLGFLHVPRNRGLLVLLCSCSCSS